MTRMIRSIKNGMSLLFACVLLLGGLAPAVSAAIPTWSEPIAPKTTTDVNKAWTVTYSDTIDASTVTADNVRVVTESGAPVKTDAVVEGKTIRVVPVASYAPGKYLLYVGPGIHSKKGELQKADIKFSFVVAPESEAKPQVIQSIKEGSVQIGGQQYTVTPQLKELFSVANKNALKNASVTFTASGSQVTEVQDLYLVNGGDQIGEQVLQGGGGKIVGNLYVESDYYHVRNLAVQGDILFSEIVTEASQPTT
ncbi:Ig-like domain-containing protein [Sporosarcina jeotgali]|uniref:Ig-like domain-containing protein n=1 Tax=Sporosarcina jeotgali TaxID=3020056 RepID=A0ABZ0KWH3_9BACL|nr:Ig-like domain-containing protein [Sporosarcina sp. B2O-1]WOV84744.1 Ig-like domain-containing protein [Sporosarcina sp. B2O-1]